MKLIFIEGPGKKPSIEKYAGKDYKVIATMGHVRDLPSKGINVDIYRNFEPNYQILPDKKKVVENMIEQAKKADEILIATDPDREGEAIAWHVAHILNLNQNDPIRIEFNEISERAVQKGIASPRCINQKLVDAQQARRVLDRLVGYKLSPFLCKKIQNNLSAGRVQSVTLKLVVDRDREIENFVPAEYWTLSATIQGETEKDKVTTFLAANKDKKIKTKAEMDEIVAAINGGTFKAVNVKKSMTASHPSAPFTTSSMQKEAGNKLGMSLKVVTQTAQSLYEGVDLKTGGKLALVSYIRTDSTRISPEAQAMAKDFILEHYGDKYVPEKPRVYKNKKDAQDAHEAIRPISLAKTPESLKDLISKNEYKLYKLIYDRFLASQMADATYNSLSVDFDCAGHKFKTTGRALVFDGYTALYSNEPAAGENEDDETSSKLPNIEKDQEFKHVASKPEQKFTKPPARFTEASLVDAMEKEGIGRPATYTQTVSTISGRKYIEKDGKSLISTELGRKVVDLLVKFFPNIMNIGFTADMEENLDEIEYSGKEWRSVIGEFYAGFEKELKSALGDSSSVEKTPDEVTDIPCEKCGTMMVIKNGKFGKFLACPNFPKCRNTKALENPAEVVAKCPKCGKNVKKLKTKTGKIFYGCEGYPECEFKSWDIPANEKCPNCSEDMTVKIYSASKVTSCPKCNFSRRDKILKEKNKVEDETSKS
ncbi:MAG: type I DNA topoisomerase [Clostridia bacterium]|nr:type I DNA topoisomerase [Clostridia bacterium]